MARLEDFLQAAAKASRELDADVYFYNGPMQSYRDLDCVEQIFKNHSREKAILFLTTNGGDPDAAYKIARYFQEKYKHFTVVVSGKCKSAGTLLAIGANEIAFTPYGELGPLDIQLTKIDRFDQLQSGLTIQETLNTLESRATEKFYEIVRSYIQANNGTLSFAASTKAASDFVTQLYAPVFSRIDPEEIGARSRSMRIAADYAKRLSSWSQNLKPDTLKTLTETYSSHSFVIDRREAETLFHRVRSASDKERAVVFALDRWARFDHRSPHQEPFFAVLSTKQPQEAQNAQSIAGAAEAQDGGDPQGTIGEAALETRPRRRARGVSRANAAAANGGAGEPAP